ncbi:MAG: mechanosensitive ion channel domain-containing protein [Acidiferrobacterales bacterium]
MVGFSLAWLVVAPPAGAANPLIPTAEAETPTEKPVELPKDLTQEQVRDLMSRLSDAEVRELLIRELDKAALSTIGQGASEQDITQRMEAASQQLKERLGKMFGSATQIPQVPALMLGQLTAGGTFGIWPILSQLVVFLAVGWLAERVFRRTTVAIVERSIPAEKQSFASRLGMVALGSLIGALAIAIFALVALGMLFVVGAGSEQFTSLFTLVLLGIVVVRVVGLASRVVLAPKTPAVRLSPFDDKAARAIHARIMVLTTLLVINRLIDNLMLDYGLDINLVNLVSVSTASIFVLALVFIIWEVRAPVAAMIKGDLRPAGESDSGFRQSLARTWHILASGYVVAIFIFAIGYALATDKEAFFPAVVSWCLIAAVPLADLGLRRLVARIFGSRGKPEEGAGEEVTAAASAGAVAEAGDSAVGQLAQAGDEGSYQSIALRNLRILLGVAVVIAFVDLWGIDVQGFARQLVGERVARSLLDISIISLLAYAVWGFVKAAVERHVGGEELEPAESTVAPPGTTRLRTLLPLLRKFLLVTLLAVVIMTALSSLGVNVGPLIAGAGMVGIAIGFGAQTLVRDIVSGMFFLLDDAFRMGEYVVVGSAKGRVQKITIRSLQLRHHNGPVHTIPFGEIKQLTNYSRDWVIMKFEIRVPFETDIEKVRKIIKNIGKDMLQDPELAPLMLGPLKSQGVMQIDDSALVIRCKFMAIPGQQFLVRRQAFTRIQKAFEENGIHFAPRRVIVEAVTPEQAVSAAAATLDAENKKDGGKVDDRG